jgi:hypothetical protein
MEQAREPPKRNAKRSGRTRAGVVASAKAAGRAARRAVPVALCAYGVLGVFGVTYWVVGAGWPGTSTKERVAIASLVAAPVALALLWPRLAGFKAFGFEVSLAQVAVRVDTALAPAVGSAPPTSGLSDISIQIQRAIARPDTELVEVDLRDGKYWWATRLFLLAALADDFSSIERFVFVEQGVKRKFVGLAPPGSIRKALSTSTPALEETYQEMAKRQPMGGGDRVASIVGFWTSHQFGTPSISERDFTTIIGSSELHDALNAIGRRLERPSLDWSGIADESVVHAIIGNFDGPYVALLREGAFERAVNRFDLAAHVALAR